MPQLVVNMKNGLINIFCRNLKINWVKMRHAPYANRCVQLEK